MAEIIIVSKTKMKDNHVCIGGVTKDGLLVRLLDENGFNHLDTIDFEIGQVYDIEFENRQNIIPPHVEDILVKSKNFKETNSIKLWLIAKKVKIWRGNADNLFDGKLEWDVNRGTSRSFLKGYISSNNIPIHSVGFWIADRDLYFQSNYGKYNYTNGDIVQLPYVGVNNPINKIPKGTIIRVSLARWWSKDTETEERCYLQLSGFYL